MQQNKHYSLFMTSAFYRKYLGVTSLVIIYICVSNCKLSTHYLYYGNFNKLQFHFYNNWSILHSYMNPNSDGRSVTWPWLCRWILGPFKDHVNHVWFLDRRILMFWATLGVSSIQIWCQLFLWDGNISISTMPISHNVYGHGSNLC